MRTGGREDRQQINLYTKIYHVDKQVLQEVMNAQRANRYNVQTDGQYNL